MMKKQLMMLLLAALLPLTANAQIHGGSFGEDGDNLTWSYNTINKTLTISGTGRMLSPTSDWVFGGAPWDATYRNDIEHVIINAGVTNIEASCFYNHVNLKTISIPSTVTEIEEKAFSGCHSLESPITIPKEQTDLDNWTFTDCYKLPAVTLQEGLVRIGMHAFSGCYSLTSLYIPASVGEIRGEAFTYCPNLTSIEVAEGNTSFYVRPEKDALICKHGDISYPYKGNTILAICKNAPIPSDRDYDTGYNLFSGRTDLTTFIVPDNLHLGWSETFADCPNLTTFVTGQTVLPGGCFKNCTSLTNLYLYSEDARVSWGDKCFDEVPSTNVTVHVPASLLDQYQEMYSETFKAIVPLADLTKPQLINGIYYMLDAETKTAQVVAKPEGTYTGALTIPATVSLEFKTYQVTSVAPKALAGSNGITSITVAAANTSLDSRDACNAIIDKETNTLLAACAATTIPTTVTAIGEGAFAGLTTLTSLSLHAAITAIGTDAFAGCTALASIECYAEAVPTIGDGAFTGVTATMQVPAASVTAYQEALTAYEDVSVVNFPEKIKTPTVTYGNGKLKFGCETEGVTFHYQITAAATAVEDTGDEVELSPVYQVTVYATREGWIDSDPATINVNALGVKGDVTGDGKVTITDAVAVVDIILNEEKSKTRN